MKKKMIVPGELTLAIGLTTVSTAVPLMVRAGFGISTISSLPYALSLIFDRISFGIWNLLFQICLLMILLAITKRFKWGYLVSFVLAIAFSLALDLFSVTLSSLPSGLWMNMAYFAISYVMMCAGISLMVSSQVPLMITDAFINDLTLHFHVTFRRMKTIFDIVCLVLSATLALALLGDLAGVGIGTVIMAFITGAGVQAVNKVVAKAVTIRPLIKTLGRIAR